MNSLKAYDSGSSSGESGDEEEVKKPENDEATLHLQKPTGESSLPKITVIIQIKS